MRKLRNVLLGAVASVALLAGASAAYAQSGPQTRTIEVPAGAVVIVLPQGGAMDAAFPAGSPSLDAAFPLGGMADMAAMMRHMAAMMNQSDAIFHEPMGMDPDRLMQAAMRDMTQGMANGTMRSVVVTSFSDGRGSCTRRVVYDGSGAPKVQVSATGDASCGPLASPNATRPAAAPRIETPAPSPARTWRVMNQTNPDLAAPGTHRVLVAQLGN